MHTLDLNKRYLVLGVGLTGASVARYLIGAGARVRVADSRREHDSVRALQSEFPGLDLVLGEFDEALLRDCDVVVINPGLSREIPVARAARERGLALIGDIELFARVVDCPVVAVTGTNGKSTVVSMLESIGRCSDKRVLCGGNIGEPALGLLERDADVVVLELSSYQLESTDSLRPAVASVLNVSEDHMDRYRDLAHYAEVKQRVYRGADCAVYPADDALAAPRDPALPAVAVSLQSPGVGEFGVRDGYLCRGEERLFALARLGAGGRHNQLNACFAWAIAERLGLAPEAIAAGLEGFTGLAHRTEFVAEIDGVRYVNDSKGTNVGATLVALQSMPGKVVLLAGGDGKSQDFSPLRPALQRCGRALVAYGADGDQLAAMARDAVPVERVESLDAAVAAAAARAEPGDCVLLSPACASFDMFSSYQHRGQAFVACVQRLRA